MSASQRRKGAGAERELCALLSDTFGFIIKRKLGQARESGNDCDVAPYRIECKRRMRRGPIYDWLEQCEKDAGDKETPVVMQRADGEDWLVTMRFNDWAKIAREEVAACKKTP